MRHISATDAPIAAAAVVTVKPRDSAASASPGNMNLIEPAECAMSFSRDACDRTSSVNGGHRQPVITISAGPMRSARSATVRSRSSPLYVMVPSSRSRASVSGEKSFL
jgi:hypothetical protein